MSLESPALDLDRLEMRLIAVAEGIDDPVAALEAIRLIERLREAEARAAMFDLWGDGWEQRARKAEGRLERVRSAADETLAAYVDEFGPETLEEPPEYRWQRAINGLRTSLESIRD